MLLRMTHYVTALLGVLAAAVVYQNTVTPWMQPPKLSVVAMSPHHEERDDSALRDLFAEGSWQRGNCKQLQTSDGMLLFENWQQTSDDQWKLWPITVVIGRGMSGVNSTAPVIIESEKGADIKFTESLDVMSGGAPPIRQGRMIGAVHIHRSNGEAEDSLEIKTANVRIDSKKIWTTDAIEMKVGQAQLVGRDLTIHLAGPTAPSGGTSAPLLERMELIYLDKLLIPLENGGMWSQETAVPQNGNPVTGQALISLHCGGRVEYDFALDELKLRESVSLVHQVPGIPPDRFDCSSLQMKLNDPANDSIERSGPLDWLVDIVATGSPAVAKLPSFDSDLAAERIELRAVDGLIMAEGRRGVRIRRAGVTATLARLVYQFDPQNPKTIGTIDARGPGIVRFSDSSIPLRKAHWHQGLRLEPAAVKTAQQDQPDLNVWVEGQFHAWLADGGEFKADKIFGVLTPEPKPNNAQETSLAPKYVQVERGVEIDTAAIEVQTDFLRLNFINEAEPYRPSVANDDSSPSSSMRQWVSQPSTEKKLVDPVARPRPKIKGDTINVLMRRNESGLSVKDLSVIGSVEVLHNLQTGGQTLPAQLTGETMRLKDAGGEDTLQLGSGPESPARFQLGDGFFIGPQIQIRTADNVVWIKDAGEFQMPTAALPTGLAGESDTKMQWTRPPHCRWRGQMLFDGRTATLSGGVDIEASLVNGREPWDLNMTGDQLRVDLLEDVQIRDMRAMRSATMKQISLLESNSRPVMVQAVHRAPDGVIEAKHVILAKKLNLTPAAGGQIVGDGPGWYRGWMRPKKEGLLASTGGQSLVDGQDSQLTGIHLVFNDSMRGDLADQNLDFLRGVRVAVRPVAGWEDAFDARTMDSISMGDSTLDCDRLRFTVDPGFDTNRRVPGAPTPWEMEAISGVVFRTRNDKGLIAGTASRAAYSSLKDLFTVDGAPNRAATFKQTLNDGSQGPEVAVSTMSIRPKTMKIENLVLERMNIAAPPTTPKR